MKKLKFILVLTLVAGSLFFSGCSKDETKDLAPITNGSTDIEAIIENPPNRDMDEVMNHIKDNFSQKGDFKASKYSHIERYDDDASTLEGTRVLWYSGTKLINIAWLGAISGFYSGVTHYSYTGDKILYQDEYTKDSPDGNWRWMGYYKYYYNSNNTVRYIVDYNTDGSIFKYTYFTYNSGNRINKIYLYQYNSSNLIQTHTYTYNSLNQISSVTIEDAGTGSKVNTYSYNSNGTMTYRSLYDGDRELTYTYSTNYWYSTEYWLGNLSKYYVYYRASGTGNFEPWDPKNMFNQNIIDAFDF